MANSSGKAARIIAGLVLIAVAVVLGLLAWRQHREERDDAGPRRNVPRGERSLLLVTVDTTRADRLGPYGAENVETPTLDRLAEGGILFERAYSVAPITLVAHTSMLTGLHPPRHGVRNNGTHYVEPEITTLAERLRDEGYRTAAVVSASVLERRYGLNQGFELYDDDLSESRERHPRVVPDRPAEFTVDHARAWLDGLGEDERFFLWVHFYDPHASYSPPPPFRDTYRERLYDGEIAYMDREIGRLLQHPRLRGGDALVALAGDHGESLGEHGENTHAILAYDSTLHVPMILDVPGGPEGVRIDRTVSQVDLMPTLLELLGMDVQSDLDGTSLLPLLEGRAPARTRSHYSETYLPYYTYGWAKLKVLRQGDWKYIEAPTPELYDLSRDPRELSNLYEREPGRAHDMTRDLGELLAQVEDPEAEAELALDPDSVAKLQALGYLAMGTQPPPAAGERPDPKDVIDIHTGLERARQLARDRLFDQAIEVLTGVMRRDPNNLAGLLDLAGVLEADDQLDRAEEILDRALGLDPNNPRIQLELAGLETRRGDHEKALELVDVALGLDERSPGAWIQKAQILQNLGRGDEAATVLEEALGRFPAEPRVQVVYARQVEAARDGLPAAEQRVRAALERDPFLTLGWQTLGSLLEESGRIVEAVAAYRDGLTRDPDDIDLHARLGVALARQGARQEAELHLREAIRLSNRPRPDLRVTLGALLAEQGRIQEADAEYERVLQQEPDNIGARNNRAIAYYRSGRAEEARRVWEELVADHPRFADAHNNLAAVLLDSEEWGSAERHARAALRTSPNMPEAWNNLGIALLEQQRLADARSAYEKALELDAEYWQARQNLASVLREQGDLTAAATALQEVLRQVPNQAEAHYDLGELYAGPLADPARARAHYNAFLRYAPADPRAAEVRQTVSNLPAGG